MKFFYNPNHMLKLLIGTSILMFFSLFIPSNKLFAITMLIWVISVFWNMFIVFGARLSVVSDVMKIAEDKSKEAGANGQHFKQGIFMMALPMCALGLVVVVIDIVVLFFI